MKKVTLFLLLSFFVFLLVPGSILASENFKTSVKVDYKIQEGGATQVTNTFSIKNLTSYFFSKDFIFKLENVEPKNIKAYEKGEQLAVTETKTGNILNIFLHLGGEVAGFGRTRVFVITYEDETIAKKNGEVWEISLPALSDNNPFDSYNVTLSVPKSFGENAYISPEPDKDYASSDRLTYSFNNLKEGVSAGFGKSQTFSFNLTYHLENDDRKAKDFQVAIPPDTSLQRMIYESIDPLASKIDVDNDGNWLAYYKLKPKSKIDVKVKGSVQVFSAPRALYEPSEENLKANTKSLKYWESDDPDIIKLGEKLKTPEAIYNFVRSELSYNFNKVKGGAERLGAKAALNSPTDALCMEFTDLFIAIARAAKIPAREINGFAYTDNPRIQPLSVTSKVLHSWPEYWDGEKKMWIPIDPTWGSTGKTDYFSKLDLRHFAFVIHGEDSVKPDTPGSYNPQKDVSVSFGTLPENTGDKLKIEAEFASKTNLFNDDFFITLKNDGGEALYNINTRISVDGKAKDEIVPILPPFSKKIIVLAIPYNILSFNTPKNIIVKSGIHEINVDPRRTLALIYLLLLFSLLILIVLSFILTKTHWREINDVKSYVKNKIRKFKTR